MTVAYLLGHGLSYVLVFGANRILDTGGFGLFYASLLGITILLSPMMALLLVFSRRVAAESAAAGRAQATKLTWDFIVLCLRWGIPLVLPIAVSLALAQPLLKVEAWQLLLLIPAAVFALFIAEVLRASLQGMLLFNQASLLWIASQSAQVALSFAFLLLFHKVWVGIFGVVLGATVVSAGYALWFARLARRSSSLSVPIMTGLSAETPMIVSYSLFMLMSNIDIILAYWLLRVHSLIIMQLQLCCPKRW